VKFWDSSAIVSLLAAQSDSEARTALFREDGQAMTWWASKVECASALNRLRREQALDESGLAQAFGNLDAFFETCLEIAPSEEVRKRAIRLLRIHPLRAADALQLAAALAASREDPSSLPLVTTDERLRKAAEMEGFLAL
jgi:uncharacterized protein